jgi:DNA polymerase III epsilon subunit-like protein
MSEVMIDLETASTDKTASILTLGAIKFKNNAPVISMDSMNTFYVKINLEDCKRYKLDVNADTMEWWELQSEEAKEEVFGGDRLPLKKALKQFIEWWGYSNIVWSNGSVFDVVIMENAFKACGLRPPWKFWNIRDTRTRYADGKVRLNDFPNKIQHHALHDCYAQINACKQAAKNLGI